MILDFYKYCETVENEWINSIFTEKADGVWNGKRLSHYQNGGVVYGLLYDHNPKIMECLNLKPDLDEVLFLMQRVKSLTEESEKRFLQTFPENESKILSLKSKNSKLPKLTKNNILEWVSTYNFCLIPNDSMLTDQQLLMFLQLSQGYEIYKENQDDLFQYDQPAIEKLYLKKELENDNYKRYRLIPVNQDRELDTMLTPCRIYDKDIDKTVFLYVRPAVAKVLEAFRDHGFIDMYSFRGRNKFVFDGYCKKSILLEEMERGVQFSFNLNKLCSVTKLYAGNFYYDQLWVIINQKNKEIKFEELDEEYGMRLTHGKVVTHMIHLLYTYDKDENVCISHLDYEYLIYTQEEFEQRKRNAYIKGTAGKRIKIFKVDKAMIPINYPCTATMFDNGKNVVVPFIYYVVYMCFHHKNLINEYFEKCLQECAK